MTREDVLKEVGKSVSFLTGVNEIKEETHLVDDLQFDDLDYVELCIDLSEALDVELDEGKFDECATVKALVDYLMTVIT